MTAGADWPSRRRVLQGLALGATVAGATRLWSQEAEPLTISVIAERFHYTPAQINVPAGRRVVLELKSLDFEHGFSLPQLKLRIDLIPDRVVRLEIPPQPAGSYGFHCDNFCGDDHEDMDGKLVVTDPA